MNMWGCGVLIPMFFAGCTAEHSPARGRAIGADSNPESSVSPEPVQHGSLSYEIDLPPEVPPGKPVLITLRARNTGAKPVDLYLRGREIAFDIIVTGEDGEVVWRRMEGKMVPAILQIRTLAPSEALELKAVWDQRTNVGSSAGPGHYRVQGTFPTDSRLPARTPPATLRIVPR